MEPSGRSVDKDYMNFIITNKPERFAQQKLKLFSVIFLVGETSSAYQTQRVMLLMARDTNHIWEQILTYWKVDKLKLVAPIESSDDLKTIGIDSSIGTVYRQYYDYKAKVKNSNHIIAEWKPTSARQASRWYWWM